jgi:hypothetical protein
MAAAPRDRNPESRSSGEGLEEERSVRRLSLNLSSQAYDQLNALALESRTSMTDIVRLALGLARIAIQEGRRGNKLVVSNPDGQAIKELVLPS